MIWQLLDPRVTADLGLTGEPAPGVRRRYYLLSFPV